MPIITITVHPHANRYQRVDEIHLRAWWTIGLYALFGNTRTWMVAMERQARRTNVHVTRRQGEEASPKTVLIPGMETLAMGLPSFFILASGPCIDVSRISWIISFRWLGPSVTGDNASEGGSPSPDGPLTFSKLIFDFLSVAFSKELFFNDQKWRARPGNRWRPHWFLTVVGCCLIFSLN